MSDKKRLINEKIKLRSVRSDYYTDSNYYPNNNDKDIEISGIQAITETAPAGISGTPQKVNNDSLDQYNAECNKKSTSNIAYEIQNEEVKDNDIFAVDPIAYMYPSYVRFYSLLPDGDEINVVSENTTMCEHLKCNSHTEYLNLTPGTYDMHFYNQDNTLLYDHKFKAYNCAITTLIITKTNNEYNVIPLKGTTTDCFYNTSYVRFIYTVPHSPAMDIYIDGIPVILGIMFNEISVFIGIPDGIHNITVTAAATSIIYVDKSFNFTSESVNDVFIVSDATGLYDLSILTDEGTCI